MGRLQTQGSRRRKCQLVMLPFMPQERQTYAPARKHHRVFLSMWERLPLVGVNRARVEGDRQLHPERSDWQVASKSAEWGGGRTADKSQLVRRVLRERQRQTWIQWEFKCNEHAATTEECALERVTLSVTHQLCDGLPSRVVWTWAPV